MRYYTIKKNKNFIGRTFEIGKLQELENRNEASVVIVLGRRRVGKTELIEQSFINKNILKFEGVQLEDSVSLQEAKNIQIENVLLQLSQYTGESHIAKIKFTRWLEFFDLLWSYCEIGKIIVYFEEVQWMAMYECDFFSDLKIAYDNKFKNNKDLIIILCGSSPSFIHNQIKSDKAFYNRATDEIFLRQFSIQEMREFFPKNVSQFEIMLAYLTVGGVPEYLKRLRAGNSIFTSLCRNSFLPDSFFSIEKDKIFVSSLKRNPYFEKIIGFLAQRKHATRNDLIKLLKIKETTGGSLTKVLDELEACGFIEKYSPLHLPHNSLVVRYTMSDEYLQFYFKFISPHLKSIQNGDFKEDPLKLLNVENFTKWLGYSFERFVRKNHRAVAKLLGFDGVSYVSGAFFTRKHLREDKNFQIDLLFMRKDYVVTIGECKYSQTKIKSGVIDEMENKISLLRKEYPKAEKMTIQKILITTLGADEALIKRAYFDRIITIDDLVV